MPTVTVHTSVSPPWCGYGSHDGQRARFRTRSPLLPPLHVKSAMAGLLGALVLPQIIFPAARTILAAATAVAWLVAPIE
jgi:hypothetical protein